MSIMMASKIQTSLSIFVLMVVSVAAQIDTHKSTIDHSCQLLEEKFAISNPWAVYPIVFEPIVRGRLTIWTGISTLPTSAFRCHKDKHPASSSNGTSDLILDFSGFATEIGWTFHDIKREATFHGVSVHYHDEAKYKVSLKHKKDDSYLECNSVQSITPLSGQERTPPSIQTACSACSQSQITLIESQLRELIKSRLEEQIIDNLYWQISQLLYSQHFIGDTLLV